MLTWGMAAVLAAVAVGTAPAPMVVTDLGAPATAYAMNDSGTVVGVSDTGTGRRAFAWQAGVMADLGTLTGGTRSEATGVNETDVVTGTAWRADGEPRAVIWRAGRITDLGLPHSHGLAINDSGQVLALTRSGGVTRRVLWTAGQVVGLGAETDFQATEGDLNNQGAITVRVRATPAQGWTAGVQGTGWTRPSLAGIDSAAADLNDNGVLVGAATDAQGRRRPIGPSGDLGTLGGPNGAATAVNDRGVIAGYADTATGASRPVLWRHGRITDLNTAGAMIATAGYRSYLISP